MVDVEKSGYIVGKGSVQRKVVETMLAEFDSLVFEINLLEGLAKD